MVRRFAVFVLVAAVSGCCELPEDPEEPASSVPAKSAGEFLAALAKRDDAAAFEMLAPIQKEGWNVEAFAKQVDAIAALRSGDEVQWLRVHYVPQESPPSGDKLEQCVLDKLRPVEIDAIIGKDAKLHLYGNKDMSGGWLWNGIEVDGRRVAQPREPPRRADAPAAAATP